MAAKSGLVPPPGVWLWTILAIALFFVASHLFFEVRAAQWRAANSAVNLATLPFTRFDPGADIYIFGTSLLRRALPSSDELNKLQYRNNGPVLQACVISKPIMRLSQLSPVLTKAIRNQPKFIFLEANLFGSDIYVHGDLPEERSFIDNHRRRIYKLFYLLFSAPRLLFQGKAEQLHIRMDHQPLFLEEKARAGFNFSRYAAHAARFRVREIAELAHFLELFQQAMAAGTRVYLLDLPRSQEAWAYLPVGFRAEFNDLMTRIEKEYGIPYLAFPHPLSRDTYYTDAAHMNQAGRTVYTTWFLDMLAGLDSKNSAAGTDQ
ncbi:MAG: hypothetical protein L3J03_06540 [Desulfobacterales bacterium]|nr:hypothetical protein [Desulfobacterales bacterium]